MFGSAKTLGRTPMPIQRMAHELTSGRPVVAALLIHSDEHPHIPSHHIPNSREILSRFMPENTLG